MKSLHADYSNTIKKTSGLASWFKFLQGIVRNIPHPSAESVNKKKYPLYLLHEVNAHAFYSSLAFLLPVLLLYVIVSLRMVLICPPKLEYTIHFFTVELTVLLSFNCCLCGWCLKIVVTQLVIGDNAVRFVSFAGLSLISVYVGAILQKHCRISTIPTLFPMHWCQHLSSIIHYWL